MNTKDRRAGRPPLAGQQRGGGGCRDPASRTPRKFDPGHRLDGAEEEEEVGERRGLADMEWSSQSLPLSGCYITLLEIKEKGAKRGGK